VGEGVGLGVRVGKNEARAVPVIDARKSMVGEGVTVGVRVNVGRGVFVGVLVDVDVQVGV